MMPLHMHVTNETPTILVLVASQRCNSVCHKSCQQRSQLPIVCVLSIVPKPREAHSIAAVSALAKEARHMCHPSFKNDAGQS